MERGQVGSQVTEGMAALVRGQNGFQLTRGDALDVQQAVRVMVEDFKSPCSIPFNNQLRSFRADTLYHAGGEIAYDTFLSVRKDLFIGINLQLHAMAVLDPFALKVNFDFVGVRQVIAYGSKLAPIPFIERVSCRCRNAGIFRMVEEDTISVVVILKYRFHKSAFHNVHPF